MCPFNDEAAIRLIARLFMYIYNVCFNATSNTRLLHRNFSVVTLCWNVFHTPEAKYQTVSKEI